MMRSLPHVHLHAPNAAVVAATTIGATAATITPLSFDAAVAAHVFEPELAVSGGAARRQVRLSVRSRRLLYAAVNVWIGGCLAIVWWGDLTLVDAPNYHAHAKQWWLIARPWLSCGAMIAISYYSRFREQLRWLRDGVPCAAYITNLHVGGKGEGNSYVVRIRYWRDPTRLAEEDLTVSKAVYDHLRLNETLTLIRHPDDASKALPYYQFTLVEAI